MLMTRTQSVYLPPSIQWNQWREAAPGQGRWHRMTQPFQNYWHEIKDCWSFSLCSVCAHLSTTADNSSSVNVSVTHLVETNIWTAKSETKIKATQLSEWCSPFTSDTRNWSTNTHENNWNNKKGAHLKLVSDIKFHLSLQAHVIEH